MLKIEPHPEDDPFLSVDEVLAHFFYEQGEEGLRALLAHAAANGVVTWQDLEEAAKGLQMAGLLMGAEIILEVAEELKSRVSPKVLDILANPDRCNRRAYLLSLNVRGELSAADLAHIAAHDPDAYSFACRGRAQKGS